MVEIISEVFIIILFPTLFFLNVYKICSTVQQVMNKKRFIIKFTVPSLSIKRKYLFAVFAHNFFFCTIDGYLPKRSYFYN